MTAFVCASLLAPLAPTTGSVASAADTEPRQAEVSIAVRPDVMESPMAGSNVSRQDQPAEPPAPAGLGGGHAQGPEAGVNFEGIRFTGFRPADPNGDVGPHHYVQAVNTSFQIFDKGGSPLTPAERISSLWARSGEGGPCSQSGTADPVVLYDHLADRWLISQFSGPPFRRFECVAVSRSADPVDGEWFLYTFAMPAGFEYPKLGVWPDGYYMSAFSSVGLDAYALDRGSMLRGEPAAYQRLPLPGAQNFVLPGDLDGPPPPSGTPNIFARQIDGALWGGSDRVELFAFHVDWANPASSRVTALAPVPVAPFDANLCNGGRNIIVPCVPQPGTAPRLETLPHWPMMPLQYRSFATFDTMMFNHSVDAGSDLVGTRWYELRRPHGGEWSVHQQGTHALDDGVHRWMASVATNRAGDIALGYSVAGATVFPGIRYAGRHSSDPPGTLPRGEVSLVEGATAESDFRWADYSAMRVDPVDGCTFWYTNQYMSAEGVWSTRIGTFRLFACDPADLVLVKQASSTSVSAGETLTYTLTVVNRGPNAARLVTVTDSLPGGLGYVSGDDGCRAAGATVTCTQDSLAVGGVRRFTFQVRAAADLVPGALVINSATVGSAGPDDNSVDNKATAITRVIERSTKTTVVSAPNPSSFGALATFTATVIGVPASDTAPPTGSSMTFLVDGRPAATVAVTGDPPGTAVFTTSSLSPGTHTVVAVFDGGAGFASSRSAPLIHRAVCDNTLSGRVSGSRTLGAGSWCLERATLTGTVTVRPGAAVSIAGSTIGGDLRSDGALTVAVCGTQVAGNVTLAGTPGPVVFGDPENRCSFNRISGTASLDRNAGGLTMAFNTLGDTTVTGNTGPGVTIKGNVVRGDLRCSANGPPVPANDGRHNIVTGMRTGQCGDPAF